MSSIAQQPIRSIEELTALEGLATEIEAERLIGSANPGKISAFHQGLKSFKQGTVKFPDPKRPGTNRTIKVTWHETEGEFYPGAAAVQGAMVQGDSRQSTSQASLPAATDIGMEVSQQTAQQGSVILGKWAISPREEAANIPFTFGSFTPEPLSPAERLNKLEQVDRTGRHADSYSLEQQSPNGLAARVLNSARHNQNPILHLAHSNEIKTFSGSDLRPVKASTRSLASEAMEVTSPYRASPAAKSSVGSSSSASKADPVTNRSHALSRDQRILMYGFDAQRRNMKENLIIQFHLNKLQTMNEYNACIGIGLSLKFDGYCNFFIKWLVIGSV